MLLLAPTWVASININGTTIHSALGLLCKGPLSSKLLDFLRNKYFEVDYYIDEISMVSQKVLPNSLKVVKNLESASLVCWLICFSMW